MLVGNWEKIGSLYINIFRVSLLENIQYAQCTEDDIKFLRTLIASKKLNQTNIAKK